MYFHIFSPTNTNNGSFSRNTKMTAVKRDGKNTHFFLPRNTTELYFS